MTSGIFAVIMSLLAIFLILLVLVQRGRGGGLAGALGGMGGSSAFGAKAGDVFTRITIVTAAIWIVLSLISVYWAANRGDAFGTAGPAPASGPVNPSPFRSAPQTEGGVPAGPPAASGEAEAPPAPAPFETPASPEN